MAPVNSWKEKQRAKWEKDRARDERMVAAAQAELAAALAASEQVHYEEPIEAVCTRPAAASACT